MTELFPLEERSLQWQSLWGIPCWPPLKCPLTQCVRGKSSVPDCPNLMRGGLEASQPPSWPVQGETIPNIYLKAQMPASCIIDPLPHSLFIQANGEAQWPIPIPCEQTWTDIVCGSSIISIVASQMCIRQPREEGNSIATPGKGDSHPSVLPPMWGRGERRKLPGVPCLCGGRREAALPSPTFSQEGGGGREVARRRWPGWGRALFLQRLPTAWLPHVPRKEERRLCVGEWRGGRRRDDYVSEQADSDSSLLMMTEPPGSIPEAAGGENTACWPP